MAEFCKDCASKYGWPEEPLYEGESCEGCKKAGTDVYKRECTSDVGFLLVGTIILLAAMCIIYTALEYFGIIKS